jgi:hypothetical protein
MPRLSMEGLRSAVRPTITWALTAAQIGLAMLWAGNEIGGGDSAVVSAAPDAFKALSPFTMMALTYYFVERSVSKRLPPPTDE